VFARAPAEVPADAQWSFVFEPYLWLAGVDGEGSADASGETSFVGGFDSAFMMRFEAHLPDYGPALLFDALTLDLADDEGSVQTETDADMLEAGFSLPLDDRARVELIAGARYVELGFDVEVGGADAGSARESWIDPWIGARGSIPFADDWSFRYRGDVGGFGIGSEFTWQGALGVAVLLGDHVRLEAGYRAISIDFDQGDLDYDALIHGPQLSLALGF
jgi:hypothetical protein